MNEVVVEAQMMIRRPVAVVFEAFVNPDITTSFWFTKSSGRLALGKKVIWEWEMYGVATEVEVLEVVPNQQIRIQWGDPPTTVEFVFTEMEEGYTYVVIKNYGFGQEGEDLLREVIDSTGGFTTVLDGAKAFLEHGIKLNLIADKFPHIKQK